MLEDIILAFASMALYGKKNYEDEYVNSFIVQALLPDINHSVNHKSHIDFLFYITDTCSLFFLNIKNFSAPLWYY